VTRPLRPGDLLRKLSVYCPVCGGLMRRTEATRAGWWVCRDAGCPGTRGRKSEFVESRESWQEEYGNFERRREEMLLKFALVEPWIDLRARALSILDYGCAYGHYLQYLRELNPSHQLYGIDIARHVVETLRPRGIADDVYWRGPDEPLPFPDGSLDMVYSFDTLEHVPNPEALDFWFGEVHRVLRPDGRLFLFIPNFHLKTRVSMLLSGEFRNMIGGDHCFMLDSRDVDGWMAGRFRVLARQFVSPVPNYRRLPLPSRLLYSPRLKISLNIFWAATPE